MKTWASVQAFVALALLFMSCAPSPAPPAADIGAFANKPKFKTLVEGARTSDGVITMPLTGVSPDEIRAWEKDFQEKFGIPLRLENVPGHSTLDVPQRILQGLPNQIGIVAITGGNVGNMVPLLKAEAFGIPPWEALVEQWPVLNELREYFTDVPGPNNTRMKDFCAMNSDSIRALGYNTLKLKPEEVKGITFDDLTTDKWKNRVLVDEPAAAFFTLPFNKEWPPERMAALAHNLTANGAKIITGGSTGIGQALAQGEGDIAFVSSGEIITRKKEGAPVDLLWPDLVTNTTNIQCFLKYPATKNLDLAGLWFGYWITDGRYIQAAVTGAGGRAFIQSEVDKFPTVAGLLKERGLTRAALAEPRTAEDYSELLPKYRRMAQDAMKAGAQSRQKVPYPWGCERNHPSCVR